MTDFTNIRTALDNLITTLDSAVADLVGTANEQRRELLHLYGRMQETQTDIHELGSMVGDAGAAMLDLEELCEDVDSKMKGVLEGGLDEIPSCNYEDLIGFCDTCGREIASSDEYSFDGDSSYMCASCLNPEAEQLTFELAESIPAVATDAE